MPGTLNVTALTDVLAQAGVDFELFEHRRTESAVDEADALGLPPHEVAKTIVVTTPSGYVRCVLPASEKLDLHKLRELFGAGKELHLLAEEELQVAYPEFELGAVPPLGGREGDRVVLDRRIADREQVLVEAGAHDHSVRFATQDLVRVAEAMAADICVD